MERAKVFGFFFVEVVFDQAIDAAAAGATAEGLAKFVQVFSGASRDHFDVAIFGVAYPSAQSQLAGLAVNKPAEADALYPALNEEVENHIATKASVSEGGLGVQLPARYTGPTHGICSR